MQGAVTPSRLLKSAGDAYRQTHGRPPVLVVDGADILHKKDPQFLADLHSLAKTCADYNSLWVVFVVSEKAAADMLSQNSSSSREESFEVGEIADADAVTYLVQRGVPKDSAADAVARIVGGRFELMHAYVSHALGREESNDEIFNVYVEATKEKLARLNVDANHALFRAMSSSTLSAATALTLADAAMREKTLLVRTSSPSAPSVS